MLAPVTHIHPLAKIRRTRTLPDKGNVLVLMGQQVQPQDVIAESCPKTRHTLIDVPAALGIPHQRFHRSMITRGVGDRLLKGDILAETKKRLNRVLRAQADGEIIMISRGRVLYELQETPQPMTADYPGTVAEVIPEYGVVIEVTGALIQGKWGNGRVSSGPLQCIHTDAGGMLTSAHMDSSLRGLIGVAGQCRDQAALLAAAELPVKGLILGSMSARLIETALQLPFPLVLLEGFTGTGINQAAAKILYEHEKRDACLNAAIPERYSGERPEVIIPLPESADALADVNEYQAGKMVRVMDDQYKSSIGIIEAVYPEAVLLSNGLRAKIASVRLENNKKITLPVVNLEILD